MMDLVFPAPAPTTLAVAGRTALFPVGRVYCIGRNYRWSPDEAAPTDLPATADLCHEIELVVAIGRGGQNIDPAGAVEHIWGYAAGLDLTRRDLQLQAKRTGGPWEAAKAFDYSAPCTPLVPAAVCGHPQQGALWLAVNSVDRQRADLAGLLWPVPALVAMLSRAVTLLPGDLIFTGTPAGVGPLQAGDVLTGGVAGIGEFSMTVGSVPTATLQQP
ncbi:MAG: fumarylacetoacetate hydrolase family protein [Polaromonas sp.]